MGWDSNNKQHYVILIIKNEDGSYEDSIYNAISLSLFEMKYYIRDLAYIYTDTSYNYDISPMYDIIETSGTFDEVVSLVLSEYGVSLSKENMVDIYAVPAVEDMFALPCTVYSDIVEGLCDFCGYSIYSLYGKSNELCWKFYKIRDIIQHGYIKGPEVKKINKLVDLLIDRYVADILISGATDIVTSDDRKMLEECGITLTFNNSDNALCYSDLIDNNYLIYMYIKDAMHFIV